MESFSTHPNPPTTTGAPWFDRACDRGLVGVTIAAVGVMAITAITDSAGASELFVLRLAVGAWWLAAFGVTMWSVHDRRSGLAQLAVASGITVLALQQRVVHDRAADAFTTNSLPFELRFSILCAFGVLVVWTVWALAGPELARKRTAMTWRGVVLGFAIAGLLVVAWKLTPPHDLFLD
jgi:hypothetical protein